MKTKIWIGEHEETFSQQQNIFVIIDDDSERMGKRSWPKKLYGKRLTKISQGEDGIIVLTLED